MVIVGTAKDLLLKVLECALSSAVVYLVYLLVRLVEPLSERLARSENAYVAAAFGSFENVTEFAEQAAEHLAGSLWEGGLGMKKDD